MKSLTSIINSKTILGIALFAVFSTKSSAQLAPAKNNAITLNQLQNQSNGIMPVLEIQDHSHHLELKNASFEKLDGNSFLIKNSNTSDIKYAITKTDDHYRGFYFDETKNEYYKIGTNEFNELKLIPKAKNEVLYTCFEEAEDKEVTTKKVSNQVKRFIGNSDSEPDVYKLESAPGAKNVVYLDFDGEGPNDTGNEPYAGFPNDPYTRIYAGDPLVKKIWEHIAEDFIPFDVNITTNLEVFKNTPTSNKLKVGFGNFGNPGWIGVAYVGSFGMGYACLITLDTYPSDQGTVYMWLAPSHEIGHTLGLTHDGLTSGANYYTGHGYYAPIMGSSWREVTHWDKGTYPLADNNEDDVQIITRELGAVPDDNPNGVDLNIEMDGSVSAENNWGTITTRDDKDKFRFEVGSNASISVTAQGGIDRPNLDIELTLFDQQGNEVLTSKPNANRRARIITNLDPGSYYLEVDGIGELTLADGFSDYGSMGYYELVGEVLGTTVADNDLAVSNLTGLGASCGENITPRVEVTNGGNNFINDIEIEVTIDGKPFSTETKNANLNSGDKTSFDIPTITLKGAHDIEVTVNLIGVQDELLANNKWLSSFEIKDGVPVIFETDYRPYNGSSPFSFELKGDNSGTIYKSDEISIDSISDPTVLAQTFCLAPECYSLTMNGGFSDCSQYPTWTSGTYVGGDIAVNNGIIYKAKWWTQSEPPAVEWEDMGICPTVDANFSFTNPSINKTYISEHSSVLNDKYADNFCVDVPTSANSLNQNEISIFPNPSRGILTIHSDVQMENISILNTLGEQVFNQSTNETSITLANLNLANGIYFVNITQKNTQIIKRITITK